MPHNNNCDGSHCVDSEGEVRVYPLGAGGNLILCRVCFDHENVFRRHQGAKYQRHDWPCVSWTTAERYPGE